MRHFLSTSTNIYEFIELPGLIYVHMPSPIGRGAGYLERDPKLE